MNRADFIMYATIIGVIVGLIVAFFVVRFFNRDGKFKTQYDEKQEIARGKGFKYGFYAMMIFECIMCVLSLGTFSFPLTGITIHFLAIFVGLVVLETYCIFNDAFIGLNTNGTRYAVVCGIITVINFISAFAGYAGESMTDTTIIPTKAANLLCGIMFAIVGVEILIKKMLDKSEDQEV